MIGSSGAVGMSRPMCGLGVLVATSVLVGGSLVLSAPSGASSRSATPAYAVDCLKGPRSRTDADMEICLTKADAAASSYLGRITGELERAVVSPALRRRAAAVFVDFRAYRTAECALESVPSSGGTIYGIEYGVCFQHLTVEQIETDRDDLELLGPH